MQHTKPQVVRKNRTTELSTYKQELIEWIKLNAYVDSDYGTQFVVIDVGDLINYIKNKS